MLSVSEFAAEVGISSPSPEPASLPWPADCEPRKSGSQWAIAEAEVSRWTALPSRPMAERVSWAPELPDRFARRDRSAPGVMRSRGVVGWWHADAESLSELAPRVRFPGVSSPCSRLSSGGLVEGYVRPDGLEALVDEFWSVPADPGQGEVVSRVSDFAP